MTAAHAAFRRDAGADPDPASCRQPVAEIAGDMARGLLRRFFQERQVGRLGLYCDSAEGGSVIAVTWPPQPCMRSKGAVPLNTSGSCISKLKKPHKYWPRTNCASGH